MKNGGIAVHLVNYAPDVPVKGARIVLPPGAKATFEEPFGADFSARPLPSDGALPPFSQYALVTIDTEK